MHIKEPAWVLGFLLRETITGAARDPQSTLVQLPFFASEPNVWICVHFAAKQFPRPPSDAWLRKRHGFRNAVPLYVLANFIRVAALGGE